VTPSQQNTAVALLLAKKRKSRSGFSQKPALQVIKGSGAMAVSPVVTASLLSGTPSPIVDISKANPAVVLSGNAHRFSTGDVVTIEDVGGMVEITDGQYTVTVIDANTYSLDGINSTAFTTFTAGGHARKQIRIAPVFFETRIRITANGGIHRGLIFELGSSTRGCAAWVGDQTIGLTAGGVGNASATATWDLGAELPVGREFQLSFVVIPHQGSVTIRDGGATLARTVSVDGDFGGAWADVENGSFASALVSSIAPGVPVASQIAPSGFEVIAPLRAFVGHSLF
jgi:hypothetical protein